MNDKDVDNEINKHANQALNESLNELTPEIKQQLFVARQTAMNSGKKRWYETSFTSYATAASIVLALTVAYLPNENTQQELQLANEQVETFMLLSSMSDTDMDIAEDLEFAYWLSEQLENENEAETNTTGDMRNG